MRIVASVWSISANSACAASSNRRGRSGSSGAAWPRRVSRSSTACASALTVRWAADVVSRLAIAARARVTVVGLARDEHVHRVDQDVEVGAAQPDHPIRDQPAGRPAGDRREPLRRQRHRGRRVLRLELEAGRGQRPVEVARDLLVGPRVDDHRDVGIGPAPGQAGDLAPDRERGEEDEQDGEEDGQRIAARDGLHRPAGRALRALREREREHADEPRDDQHAGQHQQPDGRLGHDVLGRDEEEQERADVGDDQAGQHDQPDDRPEGDPEEEDLARRRHAPEQERRGPAERGRQDLAREARSERDGCCEKCHGTSIDRRACARAARRRR